MAVTENDVARFIREKIAAKEKRIEEINQYVIEQNQLHLDVAALRDLLKKEFSGSIPFAEPSKPIPEDMGLSNAIRFVLNGAPSPMRPVEVSKELERRGWRNPGTVPIGARVAAELARLYRSGKLEKLGGRYRLSGG